jgi:phage-related protein
MPLRPVLWVGTAREDLRAFPDAVRQRVGKQLSLLQEGLAPTDCRPMKSIGAGVYELRVRLGGAFRVFYVAKFDEGVYVLHVFQKSSQRTGRLDLAIGAKRYRDILRQRLNR